MQPVQVPRKDARVVRLVLVLSATMAAAIVTSGCETVDGVRDQLSERLSRDKTPAGGQAALVAEPAPNETLTGQIQEKLVELGYKPGRITGKLNSRTEAAIQDFQLDNDLRIDGRATEELLNTLTITLSNR
ncbi:peptidoglycan-binding domain-containing protein [Granulosicoccus antarcticus]|uniref:EAL domain-containing protein n=1 Tax=Granulosicoccus antarcticus IMCC3135 TaxID=1192854 RepID=A0A2Z2NJE7_9GAMM|nr:peptidoglycan-binding domain-containing protein [Granulosicoccus antarcticus]ASJ71512.1 hypothetical protein IMCC3135_07030 [Granulosicoccus antarcticus IMCC3135]